MPRELIFRPEAEAELSEAFEWYASRVQGLGAEFLLTIDATLASIVRNPLQHPLVHKSVHRALLRRFPYEIWPFRLCEGISYCLQALEEF